MQNLKMRPAHSRSIVFGALLGTIALGAAANATPAWSSFDVTGSLATIPIAITAHNLIAGTYYDSNANTHGFLRTPDGTVTAFDAPDATYGTTVTGANNSGAIIGDAGNISSHFGFVRNPDGTFTTFQYGTDQTTYPKAINARGTIVGFVSHRGNNQAFLRKPDGRFLTLLPGISAEPTAINKSGVITGTAYDGSTRGFVRATSGDVATFYVPTATSTQPVGINASGTVIGDFVDANNAFHGFLRAPDGTITTADAPGAGSHESQGTFFTGINDDGDIAGCVTGDDNKTHGFVREPSGTMHIVDEPAAPFTCFRAIAPSGKLVGYSGPGFVALPRVWQQN